MFELDLRSRLPIYEQLIDKFKELIISEVLKANEQLPSVRALSKNLTINPNTIQKAYRELERQEYIYSIPGRGSFVNEYMKNENSEKLNKLKEELKKILSEVMYMGMKKEEIMDIVTQIDEMLKRGGSNDLSK